MRNPWLSLWLSAANSCAGALRGLWTVGLHREQPAAANELVRQNVEFWIRTSPTLPEPKAKLRR